MNTWRVIRLRKKENVLLRTTTFVRTYQAMSQKVNELVGVRNITVQRRITHMNNASANTSIIYQAVTSR